LKERGGGKGDRNGVGVKVKSDAEGLNLQLRHGWKGEKRCSGGESPGGLSMNLKEKDTKKRRNANKPRRVNPTLGCEKKGLVGGTPSRYFGKKPIEEGRKRGE